MVKSSVKAFIRTRPTASLFEGLKVLPDGSSITVKLPKDLEADLINNKQDSFSFKFDGVLDNASQEAVYTTAASEVVDNVLAGYSGCLFTYGQTGAGKTFTMAGDLRNYAHRGIIPRAVHHIFKEIDMRVDKIYEVQVSYLEIYNEQMYDLLADKPGSSEGLAIMEDAVQGTFVRGLTRVPVRSEEEALSQYFVGEQGRSTAHHVLNDSSSRSHCVFTVHLSIRTSEAASERAVLARLHLVDLAGSERTKKTNATGQTLKEAQFINKSLSFLEQTVTSLTRHDAHIPFRQSRLTSVLKDALGGNCKTVMVANIWGEPAHIEETLSTLRFASRVRQLTTNLSVAESNDTALLLKRYERQIKELKQELAMRDALSGRARVSYDDLTDSDIRDLQSLAKQFLQPDTSLTADELPADSLRRIREMYKQLRGAGLAAIQEAALQVTSLREQVAAAAAHATMPGCQAGAGATGAGVGDVDDVSRGFQVGIAPADLRPAKTETQGVGLPAAVSVAAPSVRGEPGAISPRGGPGALQGPGTDPSSRSGNPMASLDNTMTVAGGAARNEAFTRFKRETPEGRSLNAIVKEREAQLKTIKIAIKEATAAVNAAKASIDETTSKLATLGPAPGNADGIMDAEYQAAQHALKLAKAAYRKEFDVLKDLRPSLEPAAASLGDAKQELITRFEHWYIAHGGDAMGSGMGDEDELDAGEAFERMQLGTVTARDPDSVAYHSAMKKASVAMATARSNGGQLKARA